MEPPVQQMLDAMRDGSMYLDPSAIWAALRESAAMVHLPLAEGIWLCTRWADCAALARDPRLSSVRAEKLVNRAPAEVRELMEPVAAFLADTVLFMDPPRHARIRKLMGRAFSPEVMDRMRLRMETLFDQMLEDWINSGEADIMASLIHPFPALVIADMLGFPPDDWRQFLLWADALMRVIGNLEITAEEARRAVPLVHEMLDYVRAAVDDRTRNRGSDLLSLLLGMEDGDVLDREEGVNQAALLLFAGHETTRNLIGGGLHLLLSSDGTTRRIPSDPVALRLAIDELLRLASPIQVVGRVVVEDFEYDGHSLQKGDSILLGWAAANRDPRKFADPGQILLERRHNPHLAFGAGPHACLGMHLARIEAQIAFERIWQRLPDLRLVPDGTEWTANLFVRGPRKMEVAMAAAL
ncbi:putative Polyketide biosynthesis cytochrome P450 PksS [Candidatus Sulfopaludibacter sp. SbA3]|nr:putative Polyketide biosynthesis cytochrome P450 PksS [Candidatus Sulfopaludibacter sp. SbA3]